MAVRRMAPGQARLYDRIDDLDARARHDLPARFTGRRAYRGAVPGGVDSMNPVLLEIMLVSLTAICFWSLDRYVVGCDNV
jgi:hypothetical protein